MSTTGILWLAILKLEKNCNDTPALFLLESLTIGLTALLMIKAISI
jgi:hypothetical protein